MASDSFTEAQPRLQPKLYGLEHVALDRLELSLTGHGAALEAIRPAGPGVAVGVVIDEPDTQTRISETTAHNWGLPFDQILEAALGNAIGRQIQVDPITANAQMIRDPVFAACVWLRPSLLEGAAGSAARVIVTPTADMTLTGAYTPQTLTIFAGVIGDLLQAGERLESITPARLGPAGWETVAWPASGVNPILWNKAIALFADQLYGRQKPLLENQLETTGEKEIFVASHKVSQGPDGQILTHAVWSEGLTTLLPHAHQITLIGNQLGRITVPWDTLRTMLAEPLQPQGLTPERYLTAAFPHPA
ncbi:MAG: hypothetical protein LBI84_10525 [Propionibacteriaceae bacterium]|jgi:hypothetical protein|nr:hypothetical protein [Propionibacteriaceae bacterium]